MAIVNTELFAVGSNAPTRENYWDVRAEPVEIAPGTGILKMGTVLSYDAANSRYAPYTGVSPLDTIDGIVYYNESDPGGDGQNIGGVTLSGNGTDTVHAVVAKEFSAKYTDLYLFGETATIRNAFIAALDDVSLHGRNIRVQDIYPRG